MNKPLTFNQQVELELEFILKFVTIGYEAANDNVPLSEVIEIVRTHYLKLLEKHIIETEVDA